MICSAVTLLAANVSARAQSTQAVRGSRAQLSATPQGTGDLSTKGGSVQHTPTSYVVFWGSAWSSGSALTPDGQIAVNYLSDVSQTGFEKIVSQYYDSSAYITPSHTLTPYWIDTTSPVTDTSCGSATVSDAAIQSEVSHAISVNGWLTDSANATYFVYTPSGDLVSDGSGNCSETQFCTYHNWASSVGVAYAVIPYPDDTSACGVPSSPNRNVPGDSLANLTAQAQLGAITDPSAATGWADSQGNELGSKCAWDFSNGTTTLGNGGVFEISSQYSNATHSCVTTLPITGDSVGVFRPSSSYFYLRNSLSAGFADTAVNLGISTDIPLAGDWNGDGIDTIGVYRPSNSMFYLTEVNANGIPVTHYINFGAPGDIPLVGDWTGSGKDSIGVFRPSTGVVYLKNTLSPGLPDYSIVFGASGDVPIAGDWSGQGYDTIGVYRPSTGYFYLTNTNCNCAPSVSYAVAFGAPRDIPFTGDWTHSGRTGLGVLRPSSGMVYLRNDPTTSGFADYAFPYGISGDKPVAGHWY